LKREKERVGHYLHASSEQKLLEVNKFILLKWKSGIAFAILQVFNMGFFMHSLAYLCT
jgi:hypothetical protein